MKFQRLIKIDRKDGSDRLKESDTGILGNSQRELHVGGIQILPRFPQWPEDVHNGCILLKLGQGMNFRPQVVKPILIGTKHRSLDRSCSGGNGHGTLLVSIAEWTLRCVTTTRFKSYARFPSSSDAPSARAPANLAIRLCVETVRAVNRRL